MKHFQVHSTITRPLKTTGGSKTVGISIKRSGLAVLMSNRQDGRSLESSSQIARVDASGSALSIESCSTQSRSITSPMQSASNEFVHICCSWWKATFLGRCFDSPAKEQASPLACEAAHDEVAPLASLALSPFFKNCLNLRPTAAMNGSSMD
jgi:hypothetical protein